MTCRKLAAALLVVPFLCMAMVAEAQPPDLILVGGKVITLDSHERIAEALAIEGNRIAAIGTTPDVAALAGPDTTVIELGGRTVIPGLIDSHIHAIRGGLTYNAEIRWTGARSLAEGLARLAAAARRLPSGTWLNVVGGWHKTQFPENRLPRPDELDAISSDHPIYVQYQYEAAVLNRAAMRALAIKTDADVAPAGHLAVDGDGRPTGVIHGNVPTFARLFARLPAPDFDGQVAGTRAFFAELNGLGMTGIVDAAGGGLFADGYRPLFRLWRDKALTLRVAYRVMAPVPGGELARLKDYTQLLPQGQERYPLQGNHLTGMILGCGEASFAMRCRASHKRDNAPTAQKHPAFGGRERPAGGVAPLARYPISGGAPRLAGRTAAAHQIDSIGADSALGDDMLKFNGLGEVLIWGMHDGHRAGMAFDPSPQAAAALRDTASWMASHGYTAEIHASSDSSARQILDIFEAVNAETPITGLRWVIAHLEDATPATLARMKALGMGYAIQDRLYFAAEELRAIMGPDIARAPPIGTALDLGVVTAAGTDALRVTPYNPWISLRWLLDGRSVSGTATRSPDQIPTRMQALRMYSLNGAWMSFDDARRGSLEPGKLADLAVLSADYLSIPIDQIDDIRSLLTLLGGRPVHATGPFEALAPGIVVKR